MPSTMTKDQAAESWEALHVLFRFLVAKQPQVVRDYVDNAVGPGITNFLAAVFSTRVVRVSPLFAGDTLRYELALWSGIRYEPLGRVDAEHVGLGGAENVEAERSFMRMQDIARGVEAVPDDLSELE